MIKILQKTEQSLVTGLIYYEIWVEDKIIEICSMHVDMTPYAAPKQYNEPVGFDTQWVYLSQLGLERDSLLWMFLWVQYSYLSK